MATISASPEVVRAPLRWPVRVPSPSLRAPAVPSAPADVEVDPPAGESVPWRLVSAIAAVFVATLALSGLFARAASNAVSLTAGPAPVVPVESAAHRAYTVATGDTLWSIARATAPQSDPRGVVDQLREVNGLPAGHVLQVGDVLMLPDAG